MLEIQESWEKRILELFQNPFSIGSKSIFQAVLIVSGVMVGGLGMQQLYQVNQLEKMNVQEPQIAICRKKPDFEQLTVFVSGAVRNPGLYVLDTNQRVAQAVEAAGGVTEAADVVAIHKQLNFAAQLSDGESIYIPTKSEVQESFKKFDSGLNNEIFEKNEDPISINLSDIKTLEKLSGIGSVRAQKIVENRPYSSLDELVSKKIISESVYEKNVTKMSL